jgi:very-short-patch-repair endonuclease
VEERQEIARRYEAGESLEGLMAEYHRGKPTIKNVILDAGMAIRSRGYGKNREWTPEWRAAHKAATATPEFAQKSREALLKRLPTMRGAATNTAIEQRMHDALKAAGTGFTAQSLLLGHLVDIELQQVPIVIEADGMQHTLRDQKAKDAARDAELTEAGYRVFRFTGSEINTDAIACVQRVIDACGLAPDLEPTCNIRTRFSGELHPLWEGRQARVRMRVVRGHVPCPAQAQDRQARLLQQAVLRQGQDRREARPDASRTASEDRCR